MTPHLGFTTLLLASLTAMPVLSSPACAQSSAVSASRHHLSARKQHRVAIQASENDPKIINLAPNNTENLTAHYDQAGETV